MKALTLRRARSLLSLSSAVLALTLPGCGDDDSQASIPPTEPSLHLASITGAGAQGWQSGSSGQCAELGRDPDKTVIVEVRIDGDWLLRPLHNCQKRTRCGFVEVEVAAADGTSLLTVAAASTTLNVPFGQVADAQGQFVFTARLMDQYGDPYAMEDGGSPCGPAQQCTVSVTLADFCGEPPVNDAGLAPNADASLADASLDAAISDSGTVPNTSDASQVEADVDAALVEGGLSDAGPGDAATIDATVADAAQADAG